MPAFRQVGLRLGPVGQREPGALLPLPWRLQQVDGQQGIGHLGLYGLDVDAVPLALRPRVRSSGGVAPGRRLRRLQEAADGLRAGLVEATPLFGSRVLEGDPAAIDQHRLLPALQAQGSEEVQARLALPVLQGQGHLLRKVKLAARHRSLVGDLGGVGGQRFGVQVQRRGRQLLHQERVARLAYNIENAIIFGEVTHYLQQLALLNELASTASLGLDTDQGKPQDEFARRVMMRLRRTFKADWAAVLLLSPDGKTLQEYGGGSHLAPAWEVPVESSLMGLAVQKGLPVRIGDVHTATRYFPIHPDFRSELAVPLKYRGRIIGVLVLVSVQPNAFSRPDEQLLIVIASQMAGLFENMRLNEETRERAQKLADSVRQLEAVRDTSLDIAGDLDFDTLLSRLTIRARDLVGARGAELGLYNELEQIVEVVISDAPWEHVQGSQIPLMAGVAGRLAAFGEPIVVDDYNTWPGRLLPHRKASFRAVAGVPLKFKGQVIGTLTVLDDRPDKTFKSEDVNLLELLAPQAAISIRNARLYQELQERIKAQQVAEARLVRSARLAAVGEMAAGVAHELNNPLTAVAGFAELILQDLEPGSPFREDLELVLAEAERARHVVRRLLDFSRPVEDQRTKTDLNELVKGVLLLVNHLTRTSNVKIVLELTENLPWVMLDPNQIKQVFLNLVHNALQAMPKGGKLTVTTGQEEHESGGRQQTWAILAVRDTGEGIPPENVEKLFEPFFSTRPPGKGTGLGLSVSYGIISSHGGFIDVESKPGQGSCFTIYLPQEMNGA